MFGSRSPEHNPKGRFFRRLFGSVANTSVEILSSAVAFPDAMAAEVGCRGPVVTVSPVEELREEHTLARRMLGVLECIQSGVRCGLPFPAEDVAEVLTFFREFVETVHHGKENGAIYPLALTHGDDDAAQVVGELIADHDDTRDLLRSLMLFWEPGPLLDDERDGFCELAATYASRLRRHMQLEEDVLFPQAQVMTEAEEARAVRVFRRAAATRRDAGWWRERITALEARWTDTI